ncbi:MAG: diaminopimelate epimerase [Candidatus Omnitrophota bacterium]|jgi:diaminopimelate epimerase
MQKIIFTKVVASGNDFVVIEKRHNPGIKDPRGLARKVCDRKFGIGADGLLLLEGSGSADIKMRIFNPDGSEAEMCGNGARASALFLGKSKSRLETRAGEVLSRVNGNNVRIKLTDPRGIKRGIPLKVNRRSLKADYIDTGVPHAVVFVEGLSGIDVDGIGRAIRNHRKFYPRGANVDFVEALGKLRAGIRTYERGVEGETLACGTGTVASALIFALKTGSSGPVDLLTKSGEMLRVYFKRINNKFTDVWLEGKANIVYKGEYYV